MERFAKIATQRTFQPQPSKLFPKETFLYLGKQNFFIFPEVEVSSLIFQEVTF